jgi:hypothetical protein
MVHISEPKKGGGAQLILEISTDDIIAVNWKQKDLKITRKRLRPRPWLKRYGMVWLI